jgi:ribosome-binding protein aMBF1 (putative translation factor)
MKYKENEMIKFHDYFEERLQNDPAKVKEFWYGYEDFKIGALLKEARVRAGLTQEELARKINTTKSVISRVENHAEDIRLSTLEKFARALGKEVHVMIV